MTSTSRGIFTEIGWRPEGRGFVFKKGHPGSRFSGYQPLDYVYPTNSLLPSSLPNRADMLQVFFSDPARLPQIRKRCIKIFRNGDRCAAQRMRGRLCVLHGVMGTNIATAPSTTAILICFFNCRPQATLFGLPVHTPAAANHAGRGTRPTPEPARASGRSCPRAAGDAGWPGPLG